MDTLFNSAIRYIMHNIEVFSTTLLIYKYIYADLASVDSEISHPKHQVGRTFLLNGSLWPVSVPKQLIR